MTFGQALKFSKSDGMRRVYPLEPIATMIPLVNMPVWRDNRICDGDAKNAPLIAFFDSGSGARCWVATDYDGPRPDGSNLFHWDVVQVVLLDPSSDPSFRAMRRVERYEECDPNEPSLQVILDDWRKEVQR